ELVLKATKGLKPEAVDNVRLRLGEGLTGLALKEMRPICEREASKIPGYRYFPEIGEEAYDSFLAVPILRGTNRIGVMVVQNAKSDYFSQEDINTLKAITSQLAMTIETAKILLAIEEQNRDAGSFPEEKPLKFFKGRSGGSGVVLGEAVILEDKRRFFMTEKNFGTGSYSVQDFLKALEKTEQSLQALQEQVEEKLSDVASLIFTAQILMLKDKPFIDSIVHQIQSGRNAVDAVRRTVHQYVHRFESLDNRYIREKAQDVLDVGLHLLEHLAGTALYGQGEEGMIVIAQERFPSDMLKLSSRGAKGVILLSGGITSHIAILSRSLEIPLVFADESRLLKVPSRTRVLLDAGQGNVYIDPDETVLRTFQPALEGARDAQKARTESLDETRTADGARVMLLSNINLLCDLNVARDFKSEGIGLYRTEFPFMIRSDFPSEEEQYVVYKKLVEGMPGKDVTFRTLDIGGDKVLSYYDYCREENPFLGMRSIRFSLRHKDIFRQQLRAILRAGTGAELKIMFPMISSVDEFLDARKQVELSMEELRSVGVPFHQAPELGLMVELPSVLEIMDELAEEADFFSIGTNDFIQYMLAVDRTNEKVADLYLPHHPSILRALKRVVEAAGRHGKDVAVCGDMSYDERYLPYFLGIGIRKFSVDPHWIPRVQKAVSRIDLNEARRKTQALLEMKKVADIERNLL
ncbi:MAG TPA: phosphoenolpyruvate--protein phosphotransferase, partial [Candidatus Omnitrophota bacterium]|nr:phosphoenolpyruvate--protein phosphotransferase [Candidatus Omnitrophota bacterium]